MSSVGAVPSAAVPVSNARAEASRENGATSPGPKTLEGKARSSQNAKHGMRAQKYVVLPDEGAAEFAELEAALVAAELAPVGALQTVLARRVAVAAWRLARADRIEAELFEERCYANGGLGLALIRDGNGTRSFETLLRYRGAAMAEFWRALKTLRRSRPSRRPRPVPPWRPSRSGPRRGSRSSSGCSRTNPTEVTNPDRNTSRARRALAPCTSPSHHGCRTNPSRCQPTSVSGCRAGQRGAAAVMPEGARLIALQRLPSILRK